MIFILLSYIKYRRHGSALCCKLSVQKRPVISQQPAEKDEREGIPTNEKPYMVLPYSQTISKQQIHAWELLQNYWFVKITGKYQRLSSSLYSGNLTVAVVSEK